MAAITVAQLVARITPNWSIAVGLVVLATLDVVLVWATPQVQPTTTALHAARLPGGVPRLITSTVPATVPVLPALAFARARRRHL
jgi:hypothetical protein